MFCLCSECCTFVPLYQLSQSCEAWIESWSIILYRHLVVEVYGEQVALIWHLHGVLGVQRNCLTPPVITGEGLRTLIVAFPSQWTSHVAFTWNWYSKDMSLLMQEFWHIMGTSVQTYQLFFSHMDQPQRALWGPSEMLQGWTKLCTVATATFE